MLYEVEFRNFVPREQDESLARALIRRTAAQFTSCALCGASIEKLAKGFVVKIKLCCPESNFRIEARGQTCRSALQALEGKLRLRLPRFGDALSAKRDHLAA